MSSLEMPVEEITGFRLSPQQEHLWRLDREGCAVRRALATIEVAGEHDSRLLERALATLVLRNEVLRTVFATLPGGATPLQVVLDAAEPAFCRLDLRALDPALQAGRIPALARALLEPAAGGRPPVEALWLEVSPHLGFLALSLSPLASDPPGLGHLTRELARTYAALNGDGEMPPPPVQYADASEVMLEMLESEATESGRDHWLARISPELCAPLLAAGGRPGARFAPRRLERPLELGARLPGGPEGDLHVLACWQVLLWRCLDERPFAIGVAVDGRSHEELAESVGAYVRYLPIACPIAAETSFDDLLERWSGALAEAAEYADFFSWRLGAEEGQEPFSAVAFEPAWPRVEEAAGRVRFSLVEGSASAERFELRLVLVETEGGLLARIDHDVAAISGAEAERLGERLAHLVEAAARAPRTAVAELPFLTPAERRQVLETWGRGPAEELPEETLAELFLERARRSPEAVALVCGDRHLSYRALELRALGLARELRGLGVGREVRLGVAVQRSPEMVVSLLGVLAAGGAWVPLDPSYPAHRLRLMVEDSGIAGLIADGASRAGLPVAGLTTVDPGRVGAAGAPTLEAHPATPGGLAYVIYTSGSTGRPKGVMVSQRAIVNRLLWMAREFPLTAGDRVLQKTAYSFDASIWEVFSPLLAGARCELAQPGEERDLQALLATVARRRITVLQLVPSALAAAVDQPEWASARGRLRRLFCGGEALGSSLAARALDGPPAELCNLYGPTETAIDATFHRCGPSAGEEGYAPIGRPLSNAEVLLLDRRGRPVAAGAEGELYVGGAGLARGYLGRPALTAERFVPHPFSAGSGERLYRTGDLARHRADGSLEYRGRIDGQVKLRGFRIELGEVERTLEQHPSVRRAAAAVRSAGSATSGDGVLTVWAESAAGADPQGSSPRRAPELAAFLAARLPEHMVPPVCCWLAELPRLPNGKLDRGRLPEPPEEDGPSSREPRSPVEEIVAGLWGELLGRDAVSASDDFFAAGGHSLLALQLVSRLREIFAVDLKVATLFERRSLAAIAAAVSEARSVSGALAPPPLTRAPRDGELPASFAQRRLWFLDRLEPGLTAYNLPTSLELEGRLDVGALERAWLRVAARHESLRTIFAERDGEPVQRILPSLSGAVTLVDLEGLEPERRERVARGLLSAEARRPFDLAAGPLARISLVRLEARRHQAVMVLHHVVSDAWSSDVLVREMSAFYRQETSALEARLPALPIQYADYAVWQRRWLSGEVLDAEIGYWRRRLEGAPRVLELPADRPRPAVQSSRGAQCRRMLDGELSGRLRALSRRCGATLFMVLLAAFKVLIHALTGRRDLVVGTSVANRDQPSIEGLIGFFVNMLLLRTEIDGDPGFSELVARMRAATLADFDHQAMPFDELVRAFKPRRDPSRSPLCQVVFTFGNTPAPVFEVSDLTLRPLPLAGDTSVFDLALVMSESGERLFTSMRFRTDLFRESTVEGYLDLLETVFERITAEPEVRLGELCAQLERQRRQQRRERERSVSGRSIDRLRTRLARPAPSGGTTTHGAPTLKE